MRTILYEQHEALGAQFVDFGGWEMPLQYRGIREEHEAVRSRLGIFDVSHMGRIGIEGPQAEAFVEYIGTNKIAGKKPQSATYTVLCSPSGTCIDDTIIYEINPKNYFMVANAANRQKDLIHLQNASKNFAVTIVPYFEEEGILAVQGPMAGRVIASIFPESQLLDKPMQFIQTSFQGQKLYLSTTGYTGAGGYEIYAPLEMIGALWDLIIKHGTPHGILPAGLGARNTLRLEMGYALYGHEIDDSIAPTESVAAWAVKLDKPDFIGKRALLELESSPAKRASYGIYLLDPGVLRDNYPVFKQDRQIGKVTSGGYSPTLNQSIGLIMVNERLDLGEKIKVKIRQHLNEVEVANFPFITNLAAKGPK